MNQMGYKITGKYFMMHVLGNLPEEYESKVETLERDLDHQYDLMTIERMTNKINMKYKKILPYAKIGASFQQ